MPWTQEALLNRLTELGFDAPTVQHRPMHTVEDGEAILKNMPGGRCKSLFLKDKKGALWLVVMLGGDRLELKDALSQGRGRLASGAGHLPDHSLKVL